MVEYSRKQIYTHQDIQRFAELLIVHHQGPARRRYDIIRRKFNENLREESRHFQCIAGKESTIYYHYDVSSRINGDGVQIQIDSITFYDGFQDAYEAAARQGATIHHFMPTRKNGLVQ